MMLLHEILRPELIKIGLEAEKKRETISELMDVLIQYHEIPMNQRDILLEQLYYLRVGILVAVHVNHLSTKDVKQLCPEEVPC